MENRFDLWLDYHRRDADGLAHAHVDDVGTGLALAPGLFVIVGNAEADPAVAEVVAIDDDGVVLVRVLPEPVSRPQSARRSLLGSALSSEDHLAFLAGMDDPDLATT